MLLLSLICSSFDSPYVLLWYIIGWYESKYINEIVENIFKRLNDKHSDVIGQMILEWLESTRESY